MNAPDHAAHGEAMDAHELDHHLGDYKKIITVLAVATGIVWLLAALGLWALQPWARLFTMIMAGFAIFEAVLAFFQFPGSGVGFAMAIMPALILWYLSTSEVKAAFGVSNV